jgi:hypothetical protein
MYKFIELPKEYHEIYDIQDLPNELIELLDKSSFIVSSFGTMYNKADTIRFINTIREVALQFNDLTYLYIYDINGFYIKEEENGM